MKNKTLLKRNYYQQTKNDALDISNTVSKLSLTMTTEMSEKNDLATLASFSPWIGEPFPALGPLQMCSLCLEGFPNPAP